MSAAQENAAGSAGTAAVASPDASRLQQPSDAVAMEGVSQSASPVPGSGSPQSGEEPSVPALNAAQVAWAAAEKRDEPELDAEAAALAKGKDKEEPKPAVAEPTEPTEQAAVKEEVAEPVVAQDKEQANVPDKAEEDAPLPPSKEITSDASMAIGPAQDEISAATPGSPDTGPICNITLLLTSGARHPYKLDSKYLSRRNVVVPEETDSGNPDPFSISTYTLKELILREWRGDWEAKPASPTSIRLIHFGKLLEDKEPLKKYQFGVDSPNVVHMSVRPPDLDEEEPKTGGKNQGSGGGDGQRTRSGGCCVVL